MLASSARPRRALSLAAALATAASLAFAGTAPAATNEVVLPSDVTRQAENTPPTDDWVVYTRAGTPATAATFLPGALQLSTVTGGEKVFAFNYDHVGKPLSAVDDVAYTATRLAGNLQQVTALNVQIDFNGAAPNGFATLVYEPVYNGGGVQNNLAQPRTADGTAIWWSTQPINGQCSGATAACDKTWDEIVANNPDATLLAVGLNQGSGNPGLTTKISSFTFDETTYTFDADGDADGVGDGSDNCPADANGDQANNDGDAEGDACDANDDNDARDDGDDNCQFAANDDQADNDADGQGDVCDADDDNDGKADGSDNCQFVANADQANNDGDSQGDVCDADDDNDGVNDGPDNCDNAANPDQTDNDNDGVGAACDTQEQPATKDDCKNGNWATYNGTKTFRNQGDCVSFVATQTKNAPKA